MNANNCWYFNICEHDQFHAQLELSMKKFNNLGAKTTLIHHDKMSKDGHVAFQIGLKMLLANTCDIIKHVLTILNLLGLEWKHHAYRIPFLQIADTMGIINDSNHSYLTDIKGWAKETFRIKFQTGCLSIGHTIYLGVGA